LLALASGLQGNRKGAKRVEIPKIGNRAPSIRFPISSIETTEHGDPLSPPPSEFDRDELLVCMTLAFCLAGASTSIVYRLLG
jgi:hypothetical protein